MSEVPANAPVIRGATVTTEDGGRLNAFATEPRMEVVTTESGWGFHERAEKLNGRMAMLGFIKLRAPLRLTLAEESVLTLFEKVDIQRHSSK